MAKKVITVSIEQKVFDEVKAVADKESRSVSSWFELAATEKLKQTPEPKEPAKA